MVSDRLDEHFNCPGASAAGAGCAAAAGDAAPVWSDSQAVVVVEEGMEEEGEGDSAAAGG